MSGRTRLTFSRGEKEGPTAMAWEEEGVRSIRHVLNQRNPSPSRFAGPSLSLRERCFLAGPLSFDFKTI